MESDTKQKVKKGLCFALSYLILVTGAYTIGKDHGKKENVTVKEAFEYINYIDKNVNDDMLLSLHERYNFLEAQGIDEEEKVYPIGTLFVADIKADDYKTFGNHPAYFYQYWIIKEGRSNLFNYYEQPYKSIANFYHAIFPNYDDAKITANPASDDSGTVMVADFPQLFWPWGEGRPMKGVLPLAYYLTDEEITKGYITESELEKIFIKINTQGLQATLQLKK